MTPAERLQARIDAVRHGGTQLVQHLNMGTSYHRADRSIVEPRLTRVAGWPKGRGKNRIEPYAHFKIASGDDAFDLVEYKTVAEAITALAKADDEKAAREFEYAAPAIPGRGVQCG